jgi:four helix bundle protein
MATFETFEEINAWQHARDLTRDLYELFRTPTLKREFVLKDQLTRASLSIMNNIAEGFGRHSPKEFARFLTIAKASAIEVQSMLYVLLDLGALDDEAFTGYSRRAQTIIRMIGGLAAYLRGAGSDGPQRTRNSEPGTQN